MCCKFYLKKKKKERKKERKKAKWNRGNQSMRCRIQNNGYYDTQGTLTEVQGTESELRQHEKGNRNYKQKQGRNEQ